MSTPTTSPRQLAGVPRCELGESPRWDPASGRLFWVDLLAGLVHHLDPDTGQVGSVSIGVPATALARHADGWLLGVETGVQYRDEQLRLLREVSVLPRPTVVRMNDGALDPAGRFLLGSLAYDGRPGAGRLYRLDPDAGLRVLLDGLDVSNGICWSLDDRLMYHVDSGTRTIRAHDYDVRTGELGASRVHYRHPDDGAVPDGIALDVEGGLWVALWDGGRVIRLDPAGRVSDEVPLEASRPSSVAFGGPRLETLYVTTARGGAPRPGDGGLFAFTPRLPGRALAQNRVSLTPTTRSSASTRKSAR